MAVTMIFVGRHRRPADAEKGDQAGDKVEGGIRKRPEHGH
jgi:hypothetical protein